MKNETSPFCQSTSASSNQLTRRCAACGEACNGTLQCSGCLLPEDTGVASSTAYCNPDCQRSHWAVHRIGCCQTRSFKRASDIFDDVFRYALAVTHNPTYTITSIRVDNGVLLAECNGEYTTPTFMAAANGAVGISDLHMGPTPWRPFPAEVASTADEATAVMLHQQCTRPLASARGLFEMMFGRKYLATDTSNVPLLTRPTQPSASISSR